MASLAASPNTILNVPCPPLLGGGFPVPTAPSTSIAVQNARQSFSDLLETSLKNGTTIYGPLDNLTTSFSINVFSAHEEDSLFTYHYDAPALDGSVASGLLNDDTIYRIGSISKLLNFYTLLIEVGDEFLNHPVTEYVPELAAFDEANNATFNAVDNFAWSEITVGSLASHLAGQVPDININDLSTQGLDLVSVGLPPLDAAEIPVCEANPLQPACSRKQLFEALSTVTPVGLPYHTPEYSNTAFVLLAYVLEGITKKPFNASFDEKLTAPLNLSRTYLHPPQSDDNVVIPFNNSISLFGWDLGDATTAGGMYSSISDLTKVGQSILRSDLLAPSLTRKWMKPVTHTSSLFQSVGLVWEIMRLEIPISKNSKATRIVDLYTKNGNFGAYTSILVLDPEHDIGFTILLAGVEGRDSLVVLSELISNTWVAALEEAAREQAQTNLIGTYESTDPSLNSTITFSLTDDRGGLGISNYISNSSDILATISAYLGADASSSTSLSISLYSTGLQTKEKSAFRGIFEVLPTQRVGKSFSNNCASWGAVSRLIYGNVGIDDIVFDLDPTTGKALRVSPRMLRTTLQRV